MPLHIGEFDDVSDRSTDMPVSINNCGRTEWSKGDLITTRRRGRSDYMILYVVSGSLSAEHGGVRRELCEGELVTYFPREPQYYALDGEKAPVVYFVHFSGSAVGKMFSSVGAMSGFGAARDRASASFAFSSLSERFRTGRSAMLPDCADLCRVLYALFAAPENEKNGIGAAVAYLRENFAKKVSAAELAALAGVSVSRFYHAFREAAVTPFRQYLISLRLFAARGILSGARVSVSEAAARAGFDDALYFSRLFKRAYGESPSAFAKRSRPT